VHTYRALRPDQLTSATCPLKYLRVTKSLWVDMRFIEVFIVRAVRDISAFRVLVHPGVLPAP
jgi:hypothetical protein